jgi:hypothetical protein
MLHILPNDQRSRVTAAAFAVGLFAGGSRRPPAGRSAWRVDDSMVALLFTTRG